MREPRRIFISHNVKQDPEANKFLDEVIAAISSERDGAGEPLFEVLVDRGLTAGEPWRTPLYTWMLLCDTAVMLLDARTKDSTWVPREAMIFSWRRQLDPGFTLLPVLRGVGKDIFQAAPFTEMGLENLGNIACEDVSRIVETLKLRASGSTDRRFGKLEECLPSAWVSTHPSSFREMQELLGIGPEVGFLKTFEPVKAVVAALFGFGFREQPADNVPHPNPSAYALTKLAKSLEGGPRSICDILSSYWVAREASADLFRAVPRPRVIAMPLRLSHRTGWDARFVQAHFAEAFSQHILGVPKVLNIPEVSPGSGMDDEVSVIERCIRGTLWKMIEPCTPQWSPQDEPRFAKACKSKPERPAYFFWASDRHFKIESLITVQQRMPYLRLVYLSTGDPPEERDEVYWLETNLDLETEETILGETDEANSILGANFL